MVSRGDKVEGFFGEGPVPIRKEDTDSVRPLMLTEEVIVSIPIKVPDIEVGEVSVEGQILREVHLDKVPVPLREEDTSDVRGPTICLLTEDVIYSIPIKVPTMEVG